MPQMSGEINHKFCFVAVSMPIMLTCVHTLKSLFQKTSRVFGETQLVNGCSNGVRCTSEEHQANRRTEFKVVAF